MNKETGKFLSVALVLFCSILQMNPVLAGNVKKPPPSGRQFSREEFMVMNLNRGENSSGAIISDSLKQVRQIVRDLDKSLRQLQQVDREFAKSKGKPDDKFLEASSERLQQALKTAQTLSDELEGSRETLKDNIQHALIMAPQ